MYVYVFVRMYVQEFYTVYKCIPTCVGCSQYTIIPARYAYLLRTDITDNQAAVLERKNHVNMYTRELSDCFTC